MKEGGGGLVLGGFEDEGEGEKEEGLLWAR